MGSSSNENDEIDLGLVYQAIKRLLVSLWDSITSLFLITQKRWPLVLIFSLLGIGGGIGLFMISKPTYISTLTLSSNVLTNDFCSDIIHDLELIVEDQTPKLLAQRLKMDTGVANEIKRIEFYNYDEQLKDKYKDKDTIVLGRPFKVRLFTSKNNVFEPFQKALVDYLENNEYALKRKEIKKAENKQMREKLNSSIYQLDSLKKSLSSNLMPRGNPSGFVFGQPIDPVNVYKEAILFFQKELDLSKEAILIDNIQVISDFSARDKPDSPRIWKTTSAGGCAGLLFGVFLAAMLERRKKN